MTCLQQLADTIKRAPTPPHMPTSIVAVDGCGGAGKSALVRSLITFLDAPPVVPTDNFASWDTPLDWWPRLLEQVLRPLSLGMPARYQRYDWGARKLTDWVDLPPRPSLVIIEGVGSMRREFDSYLAYRIWVDAPRELRLQRGLERDGEAMRSQWQQWMDAEDAYLESDQPLTRADLIVSGAS